MKSNKWCSNTLQTLSYDRFVDFWAWVQLYVKNQCVVALTNYNKLTLLTIEEKKGDTYDRRRYPQCAVNSLNGITELQNVYACEHAVPEYKDDDEHEELDFMIVLDEENVAIKNTTSVSHQKLLAGTKTPHWKSNDQHDHDYSISLYMNLKIRIRLTVVCFNFKTWLKVSFSNCL